MKKEKGHSALSGPNELKLLKFHQKGMKIIPFYKNSVLHWDLPPFGNKKLVTIHVLTVEEKREWIGHKDWVS